MKTTLLLIGSFLTLSLAALAGNDPLLKKNAQLDFNYQFTKFNSVFDNDGELKPVPEIRFSSLSFNARYGIKDNLTANLIVPAFNSASNSESKDLGVDKSKSFSGLGDVVIGFNYALTKQNKIQPVISFYQNLATGKNNADGLSSGFGDFANTVYFDLFYEYNSHIVLNGNIGYQNRKKNFKNDFLGNFFIHYIQKDKFQVSLFMKGKLPFSELSNEENIVNYGLFKNSEGFFRYGASADIRFRKNMSLTVNYENYVKGQFIGAGPIYTAGLKLNFGNSEANESDTGK